jgi:hypothetical protein
MKFIIRKLEFEICYDLKNYHIVRNVNDFKIGDYLVGSGILSANDYQIHPGIKCYYLVAKKNLQVFASFQVVHIGPYGYKGNLKHAKANYVIAEPINN